MKNIIALCGWPKSGKDTAARLIVETFGGVVVDDGQPLRLAAAHLFAGMDLIDAYSQEGKDRVVDVCGKPYHVRKLLGDLGTLLEDHYGEFYVPEQAMKRIETLPPDRFVLSAVRKRQGHFYREQGALVLEVKRDVPVSPHAFDWYDPTACHDVIDNTGDLDQLQRELARIAAKHSIS